MNKHDCDFDDVSKIGQTRFSENKGILERGYVTIISINDVIYKILSDESNYNEDVVMWSKFGNSSISMTEVTSISITSILETFDQGN